MGKTVIPEGYRSLLSLYETQKAISLLKRLFEDRLAGALRLHRVSAPLFVSASSGLNDDLNGVERPVSFEINRVEDTAQDLEDLYPQLSPKERENTIVREHGAVFLMGIGGKLKSGQPHDGRAPDYDDWNLNGDILFWDSVNGQAIELSSMGIRVSPESLDRQLTLAGCDSRRSLPFHRMLLNGELPLTMGGGIGQSRVSMLLLGKAHIGEVQSSLWDPDTVRACEQAGVVLL